MKLNPLYKKLLLLSIVFGPIFWLVFTEDGQRRGDMVLISLLKGSKDMDIAFAKLQGTALESDLLGSFPKVPFQCQDQISEFGNRLCAAPVASFNGAPASHAVVFFRDGRLSAVKMTYQYPYHKFVSNQVSLELGVPITETSEKGTSIWRWKTDHGSVLMPLEPPERSDEPTVIWLSNQLTAS